MKRENPIREAIDDSLRDVRFDAHDARSVLRAVRSREDESRARARPRRGFRPDFAFALTLIVIIAAPLSLTFFRSQNTRDITAAVGSVTPSPSAVVATALPEADPILETTEESEAIRAARACFEAQCDTSIFSFEEYAIRVAQAPQGDGTSRFTVTMDCVYDNGCSFTCVVSMPSGEILQHSTPELATIPMFFDAASDEVQSWYQRYGAFPFTWDAQTQVEFSRRYEGAAIRLPKDGEIGAQQASAKAAAALQDDAVLSSLDGISAFENVCAYPVLYAERANSDGRARYVVYCFDQPVSDSISDPCVLVTVFADTAEIDSIEVHSAVELADVF